MLYATGIKMNFTEQWMRESPAISSMVNWRNWWSGNWWYRAHTNAECIVLLWSLVLSCLFSYIQMARYPMSSNLACLAQRGKFRPRLQNLVESNSEEQVEMCSRKAFRLLPDLKNAISALTELKGVGPATASGKSIHIFAFGCAVMSKVRQNNSLSPTALHTFTQQWNDVKFTNVHGDCASGITNHSHWHFCLYAAVLAAGSPEVAPFMADEAVEAVCGGGKVEYTQKAYLEYAERLKSLAADSNESKGKLGSLKWCVSLSC